MKTISLILMSLAVFTVTAQIVDIPDVIFKNALLDHVTVIDVNGDGEIQFSEAAAVTQLQVNHKDIIDLTGIEAFINLTHLNAGGNLLTSVDLSQNTGLRNLILSQNLLTEISLTENEMLESVSIQQNELITIDISNASNLIALFAFQNFLSSIDLSNNSMLQRLVLNDNDLNEIDISNLSDLLLLELVSNNISSLDLSANLQIRQLDVSNNNLTLIDVSNNSDLRAFRMTSNPLISEVDLSNNGNLCQVWLSDNKALRYINLKNGNNVALDPSTACNTTVGVTTSGAVLEENPVLENVCVDSITFAEANFQTSFPVDYIEDCLLGIKQESIVSVLFYPNPVTSEATISTTANIEEIVVFNLLAQKLISKKTSTSEEKINLSNLSEGTYLIEVRTSMGTSVFRVIKE